MRVFVRLRERQRQKVVIYPLVVEAKYDKRGGLFGLGRKIMDKYGLVWLLLLSLSRINNHRDI